MPLLSDEEAPVPMPLFRGPITRTKARELQALVLEHCEHKGDQNSALFG